MKVVKADYQLIEEKDVIKKIERIARVCYKSEDKIAEGTDIIMCKKLVVNKHLAMLEHGTLAYIVPKWVYNYVKDISANLMHEFRNGMGITDLPNPNKIRYTAFECSNDYTRYVVSGNLRAWYEFFEYIINQDLQEDSVGPLIYRVAKDSKNIVDWVDVSELSCCGNHSEALTLVTDWTVLAPVERMVHETFSILFTVDRGVTHELVRMREASFAQESTRYCNYSNGKYGSEITVIDPCFWPGDDDANFVWESECTNIEAVYNKLSKDLNKPAQQSRAVLPTSVKADIVVTSNLQHWRHMFNLRACDATGPAHPQMKEVMIPALLEMKQKYDFAFGDLVEASMW